ncbi:MAG: DUF2812 domain-containing protein [Oscillospiraceae bacterium]|nr:DUF2812 domain-containing protein [Oscillospiraceae bacterium]
MKPVYMRQVYIGAISDLKNLEHHFRAMAAKGWMIDKISQFSHRYRAAEPCEKRFFVDLLPQITVFDYPENEDAQDYRRICEESGWAFVTANQQLHVFCAEGDIPAPTPIHTDHRLQAEIYLKACRRYELLNTLLPLLFIGFMLFTSLSGFGIEVFLNDMMLFVMLGYLLFLPGYIWVIGYLLVWYRRVRKSAGQDLPMPAVDYCLSRIRRKLFMLGGLAGLGSMLAGIVLEISRGFPAVLLLPVVMAFVSLGIGLWLRRQINLKRRGRRANIRLFAAGIAVAALVGAGGMVFTAFQMAARFPDLASVHSLDGRPALRLADMGVTAPPTGTDTVVLGSVAVPVRYRYLEMRLWQGEPPAAVTTEVYRPVSRALTRGLYSRQVKQFEDSHRHALTENIYLSPDEAALWGADEGIANRGDTSIDLLLRKDKTILRLNLQYSDMNPETVQQAVLRLWA